jgi:hypothetical protein
MRIATAIWGFWFAAAFLELPGVHVCAVHAAAHATAHEHHHTAPSHDGKDAHCTCLAHCCGTSPAVLSAATRAVEAPEFSFEARAFRAPIVVVVVERPHARPFANAPPVA